MEMRVSFRQGKSEWFGASAGIGKPSHFPLLPEDLVAQNIDVILNRRNCMAATLRIIEENIPEVRPLPGIRWEEAGWNR